MLTLAITHYDVIPDFIAFFLSLLLAQPSCDRSPCYPSHSVSEHIHLTCKCQLGAVQSGTRLDNELCPLPPGDTLTPFLLFPSAAALLAPLFCGNRIFSKVEQFALRLGCVGFSLMF